MSKDINAIHQKTTKINNKLLSNDKKDNYVKFSPKKDLFINSIDSSNSDNNKHSRGSYRSKNRLQSNDRGSRGSFSNRGRLYNSKYSRNSYKPNDRFKSSDRESRFKSNDRGSRGSFGDNKRSTGLFKPKSSGFSRVKKSNIIDKRSTGLFKPKSSGFSRVKKSNIIDNSTSLFKPYHSELLKIANLAKQEYNNLQTTVYNQETGAKALKHIKRLLEKLPLNYHYQGPYTVQIKCYLDGEDLFLRGMYGFAITAQIANQIYAIDPITYHNYWTDGTVVKVNSYPIKNIECFFDHLSYKNYSNTFLLFWNSIGKAKHVELDPNGLIQSLKTKNNQNN